ncbi:MAG: HAD family phosphatase [Anaerolineae bacterium]|nr:HAD family phosphatase [Anaerolineae bacterium]
MSAKRKIEAVVFDLDGLMVDSEPLARRAWDKVLEEYGHRLDDETHAAIVGRRTGESAQIVRERFALPVDAEELAAAKTRQWQSIWALGLPPMPGLYDLQRQLARRHVPWGVATSSPRMYAAAVVEQLGLAASCRAIAAGDEVTRGKPAPDIYLLAAERLGMPPQACLAFEDSEPGARAAQSAGMLVVAIPNGAPAHGLAFADFLFDSLSRAAAQIDSLLGSENAAP